MFFSHIRDFIKLDDLSSKKINIILIGAGDAGQAILHQFSNKEEVLSEL